MPGKADDRGARGTEPEATGPTAAADTAGAAEVTATTGATAGTGAAEATGATAGTEQSDANRRAGASAVPAGSGAFEVPDEADAVDGVDGAKGVVSAPGPDGPVRTTRRFPLFTRDTARPEGGGRAAPRDAPAPARQWPLIAVLGMTALGLLLVAVDAFGIGFRLGTVLVGVALLTGAVLRWFLPSVGMLAVRSRFTDIVTYGALGLTITLLAMMAQPNGLKIPILESVVRFTVR
ncbi:DUF3017 domain-containing protein [Streptomyces candidus]|uniref:DUF3017 domain-containing protein n=1 Tax=Streptomyces candidus TaxID=67283 RepID=A0A7X0LP09_9ACTN|nr:DUF3017 domain-containing protein [Streptomyces candidus]MBB6435014.1 hypothetical protein [Streptomyces candidus]GHH41024.1 hypothetical protein GCM10018773_23550 [Streptomyces candidus]